MPIKQLLNEVYRPQKVDDYVFPNEDMERRVRRWISEGEFPNLLLYGKPGVGKSSAARMIINEMDIDDSDVMTINGSSQGIDYIRDVVEPWTAKTSFSPFKVVLIEEIDALGGGTQKAQKMLRQLTEDTTDRVRWIFTANYVNSIEPALRSRFEGGTVEINEMSYDGVVDLVVDIIEKEEIVVNDPESDLLPHIDMYQPDIRRIINSIDGNRDENNVLYAPQNSSESQEEDKWLALWESGNVSLEKALGLSGLINASNFEWFYEVMYTNSSSFPNQGLGIVLCSEYLDRSYNSANHHLHLDAFLYRLWMESEEE